MFIVQFFDTNTMEALSKKNFHPWSQERPPMSGRVPDVGDQTFLCVILSYRLVQYTKLWVLFRKKLVGDMFLTPRHHPWSQECPPKSIMVPDGWLNKALLNFKPQRIVIQKILCIFCQKLIVRVHFIQGCHPWNQEHPPNQERFLMDDITYLYRC